MTALPDTAPTAQDEQVAGGWRRPGAALGRFARELARRCRERGRTAVFRAGRITGATVAAFLAAEAVGLREPPPLVAALTALLVVQATLASTLVNGVQRVLSVVAGVALAAVLVSVVGLTWWSLGALVAASILVGQILRLGPHLLEVPISAMLVLGVGYVAGAESVGMGRVLETLVGAAVGVAVNVAFPPAVQTRNAGGAVRAFAEEIAALLEDAAAALGAGPVEVDLTARWLDDARRLNRHVARVDLALEQAEESRRLNVRALGTPKVGRSLRDGLDALERCSVSVRAVFRAVHDATREQTGIAENPGYADEVRAAVAAVLGDLAGALRTFGTLVHAEITTDGEPEQAALTAELAELRERRARVAQLLLDDTRSRDGLWELNSAVMTTTDRLLDELDVAEHARMREADGDAGRARRLAERAAARAVERLRHARPHLPGRSDAAGH